jgi:hypothetical protein
VQFLSTEKNRDVKWFSNLPVDGNPPDWGRDFVMAGRNNKNKVAIATPA